MTSSRTTEEIQDRQRGWLTLIAVVLVAGVLFLAFWALMVGLYLLDPGPAVD